MRDDDPTFHEETARIEQKERIAQEYLDKIARHPYRDPILDLPLADYHFLTTKPQLLEPGAESSSAVARIDTYMGGGSQSSAPTPILRSKVSCRLVPGHDGPHVAKVQREFLHLWRVWQWSETLKG